MTPIRKKIKYNKQQTPNNLVDGGLQSSRIGRPIIIIRYTIAGCPKSGENELRNERWDALVRRNQTDDTVSSPWPRTQDWKRDVPVLNAPYVHDGDHCANGTSILVHSRKHKHLYEYNIHYKYTRRYLCMYIICVYTYGVEEKPISFV